MIIGCFLPGTFEGFSIKEFVYGFGVLMSFASALMIFWNNYLRFKKLD